MPDYQNGKIYRISSNGKDYYGSTTVRLSKRFSQHNCDHKAYVSGESTKYCTSYEVLDMGDAYIVLVENYPCNSKEELLARERYYQENFECVNKMVAGRTQQEWHEDNKEHIKEYQKHYKLEHKEELKLKHSVIYTCGCGSSIRQNDKSRHFKSLKHQQWEKDNNIELVE